MQPQVQIQVRGEKIEPKRVKVQTRPSRHHEQLCLNATGEDASAWPTSERSLATYRDPVFFCPFLLTGGAADAHDSGPGGISSMVASAEITLSLWQTYWK